MVASFVAVAFPTSSVKCIYVRGRGRRKNWVNCLERIEWSRRVTFRCRFQEMRFSSSLLMLVRERARAAGISEHYFVFICSCVITTSNDRAGCLVPACSILFLVDDRTSAIAFAAAFVYTHFDHHQMTKLLFSTLFFVLLFILCLYICWTSNNKIPYAAGERRLVLFFVRRVE
jgi:hypothetical protein